MRNEMRQHTRTTRPPRYDSTRPPRPPTRPMWWGKKRPSDYAATIVFAGMLVILASELALVLYTSTPPFNLITPLPDWIIWPLAAWAFWGTVLTALLMQRESRQDSRYMQARARWHAEWEQWEQAHALAVEANPVEAVNAATVEAVVPAEDTPDGY